MSKKPRLKSKLTSAERHARFKEMARKVEASDDSKDFERAFKKVISMDYPSRKKGQAKS